MRVGQFIIALLCVCLSLGVVAQQTQGLSYDEMKEIEEVHLGEHAAGGSGSTPSSFPLEHPQPPEHSVHPEPPEYPVHPEAPE